MQNGTCYKMPRINKAAVDQSMILVCRVRKTQRKEGLWFRVEGFLSCRLSFFGFCSSSLLSFVLCIVPFAYPFRLISIEHMLFVYDRQLFLIPGKFILDAWEFFSMPIPTSTLTDRNQQI